MEILRRFDEIAARFPDRVAHRSGRAAMTYGELAERSRNLAAWCPGGPVALLGHKEPAMLVGFLGAMRAGLPYVPLDVDIPPARIESIVTTARAEILLRPEDVLRHSDRHASAPAPDDDPHAPVYLMFTSGSTGEPKGVVITRECLHTFVFGMLETLGARSPTDGEVVLNQTPFSFDFSVMDVWLALLGGGTLVSLSREEVAAPREMYRVLEESGATTWISTPSFVQMCMAERRFSPAMLPRLKRFGLGGEALPPALLARVFERFPGVEMWDVYGPTEATVACTLGWVEPWMLARYPSVPIGDALPGTWVGVLHPETLEPAPDGEKGEIAIAGPNVSPGYLHRPDLTEKVFFTHRGQRAYRTGDWGHVEDGRLFYDGRMHGLVKVQGNRIELGDVEANLCALEGIEQAVVLLHGGSLVGFLLLDRPRERPDFELAHDYRKRLESRVPRYMVPRHLVFLDRFPMTGNGKVDKARLAELAP